MVIDDDSDTESLNASASPSSFGKANNSNNQGVERKCNFEKKFMQRPMLQRNNFGQMAQQFCHNEIQNCLPRNTNVFPNLSMPPPHVPPQPGNVWQTFLRILF